MDNTYEQDGFEQEPVENRQPEPEQPSTPEEAAACAAPAESESATQPQTESQEYRGTGAGRKESPFANSPYYTYGTAGESGSAWNPQEPAHPEEPARKSNPKKAGKTHGGKAWRPAIAAVLTVALVAGSCAVTAATVNSRWEKKTSLMEQTLNLKIADLQNRLNTGSSGSDGISVTGSPVSTGEGLTPSQVYARNVDSVVAISNQGITTNIYGQVSETASSGTGFILSEDGYVVTNYHVVEDATTLTVITFDGTEYDARLVGYDSSNDVALLKVEATGLTPVTIGSSDDLIVGDQVVAIGNPLGELTSSLSVGYVSAKDRTINTEGTYINMIQIDAAINPGNSGGPLFNMKGDVVGITTAKYSGSTSTGATIEGIGFAIPMDDVMSIVSDLKQYGYVTGAYLGISVTNVTDEVVASYGLPHGAKVESVTSGSCAEKAGLQQRDIITGLGSYEVTSITDLTRALRKFQPGDTTTITVYRSGQTLDLTVTLDAKPAPQESGDSGSSSDDSQMPSNGSYEEWYNYFAPFFGGGRG